MMGVPRKGFQRGMRFLRWINETPQAEIDAAMKPKPAKPVRCWYCQGGRGLHLCTSCAVSVKSIVRRCQREHQRRP